MHRCQIGVERSARRPRPRSIDPSSLRLSASINQTFRFSAHDGLAVGQLAAIAPTPRPTPRPGPQSSRRVRRVCPRKASSTKSATGISTRRLCAREVLMTFFSISNGRTSPNPIEKAAAANRSAAGTPLERPAGQIISSGFQHGLIRNHADDFAARHDQTALGGQPPGFFQNPMRRRHAIVRQIDRNFVPLILIDIPADRLAEREFARPRDSLADDCASSTVAPNQRPQFIAVRFAAMPLGFREGGADEIAMAARKMSLSVKQHFAAQNNTAKRFRTGGPPRSRSSRAISGGGGPIAGVQA